MATKTITIELDVYDRLVAQKRTSRDSFSQVLRRAHWDRPRGLGSEILASLESDGPLLDDGILDEIERLKGSAEVAPSKWDS
jgi:predicted CopG family antitoxin